MKFFGNGSKGVNDRCWDFSYFDFIHYSCSIGFRFFILRHVDFRMILKQKCQSIFLIFCPNMYCSYMVFFVAQFLPISTKSFAFLLKFLLWCFQPKILPCQTEYCAARCTSTVAGVTCNGYYYSNFKWIHDNALEIDFSNLISSSELIIVKIFGQLVIHFIFRTGHNVGFLHQNFVAPSFRILQRQYVSEVLRSLWAPSSILHL